MKVKVSLIYSLIFSPSQWGEKSHETYGEVRRRLDSTLNWGRWEKWVEGGRERQREREKRVKREKGREKRGERKR